MYPKIFLLLLNRFLVRKEIVTQLKKKAGMEENAMLTGKDNRKLVPG